MAGSYTGNNYQGGGSLIPAALGRRRRHLRAKSPVSMPAHVDAMPGAGNEANIVIGSDITRDAISSSPRKSACWRVGKASVASRRWPEALLALTTSTTRSNRRRRGGDNATAAAWPWRSPSWRKQTPGNRGVPSIIINSVAAGVGGGRRRRRMARCGGSCQSPVKADHQPSMPPAPYRRAAVCIDARHHHNHDPAARKIKRSSRNAAHDRSSGSSLQAIIDRVSLFMASSITAPEAMRQSLKTWR